MMLSADVVFAAPQVQEVRQVFDEERALAEFREQESIGKRAVVRRGEILLEMRRAYPGPLQKATGYELYSDRLIAFLKKLNLSKDRAKKLMQYANNPAKADREVARKCRARSVSFLRTRVLTEIRDALRECSKEEVLEAINRELANAQTITA